MKRTTYLLLAAVFGCSMLCGCGGSDATDSDYEEQITQSKYQTSNKNGISCNGSSDIAIEAANVFADNYGSKTDQFYIESIDGSYDATHQNGTLRVVWDIYNYYSAGGALYADSPAWGCYTSTISYDCTDYGSYRNYTWYDIPTEIQYH